MTPSSPVLPGKTALGSEPVIPEPSQVSDAGLDDGGMGGDPFVEVARLLDRAGDQLMDIAATLRELASWAA